MFTVRTIVLATLSFGILLPVRAETQEAETPNFFKMSLDDLQEQEIYTASKFTQQVAEAPSSVVIITSEEIKRYGYRSLGDILNSIPGFYITYDRNYHYVGVRGFGRPGDYNARILLLLDGFRFNENVGDGVYVETDSPVDVDLIDRVEIVRGPGSALYGSNAIFAVVNVITKKGRDFSGGQIAASIGSFGTRKGRFSYGDRHDNGMEFLFSGTWFDADGDSLYFREFDDPATNYGKVSNDDEKVGSLFGKVSFHDLTLEVAHTDRNKNIPTAPWESVFGDRRTEVWDAMTLVGLTCDHAYSDEVSLLGRVSYQEYDYDGTYVYDDEGAYLNHDFWRGRWVTGGLQLTARLGDSHTLVAGVETQYNSRQDQKNWDSDIYLDDIRHSKSWGIYAQDEWRITESLILTAGVRRDVYDSTGSTVNPRAALIYKLREETTLKFLAGRAFRAPSVYELYYHDLDTTKASPDLEPETIKTYEFVVENAFSKRLKGTASVFHYKMDNLIDQTVDPDDDMIVFQNVSQVTANGGELALEATWDGGIRGRIGYAYVEATDEETDSRLANSPRHMINTNLIYPLMPERLFAGVDAKYISKRKTLTGSATDDAIVTNLTLTYDDIVKNLNVQFGVYNLFDVSYAHPGFAEHLQDELMQDGRTFAFKMTYSF